MRAKKVRTQSGLQVSKRITPHPRPGLIAVPERPSHRILLTDQDSIYQIAMCDHKVSQFTGGSEPNLDSRECRRYG